jgi:hypothetical protein
MSNINIDPSSVPHIINLLSFDIISLVTDESYDYKSKDVKRISLAVIESDENDIKED